MIFHKQNEKATTSAAAVVVGGGPEAGLVFVEIQRGLLAELERLFVTMADDRY